MTGFDATVPTVASAASTSASVAADLRAELHALRAEAEAVLAGGWRGRAAASFECAWRDWYAEASAVIAMLTELAEALRATATSYRAGDDTATTQLLLAGP